METVIQLINEVGVPVTGLIGLGWLLNKLLNKIMGGIETAISTTDESINAKIDAMEERLQSKIAAQHSILVALIDRVRSVDNEIIRQDTLLKTMLGVPNLIDTNKIAKAERDDQRKD
tara:strand:+ start:11419 stop:11769 length:351 start_codon:yes stop_codon:yes gene_type:complete